MKKSKMPERLPTKDRHESQRGYFAYDLHHQMQKDENIWVITCDLGFGMWDKIKEDFPDRFVNVGAAEQVAIGAAVGMTYENKIPVVYSITNFLLYRPYEWLRNYVDHEEAPVKLVASGRDNDYAHDGYTHESFDAKAVLSTLPNIVQFWPTENTNVTNMMDEFLHNNKPSFMSLRR